MRRILRILFGSWLQIKSPDHNQVTPEKDYEKIISYRISRLDMAERKRRQTYYDFWD